MKMKTNILAVLAVLVTLGTIGADTYLIITQVWGPIIPVIISIIITSILTLFFQNLLSACTEKDIEKDEAEKKSKGDKNFVDIASFSKSSDSSKDVHLNTGKAKKEDKNSITV